MVDSDTEEWFDALEDVFSDAIDADDASMDCAAERGAELNDEEWFDYIYIRDNPRGVHQEYWQHITGCRSFVKVLRDTVSHEVLKTGLPSDDLLFSYEAEK